MNNQEERHILECLQNKSGNRDIPLPSNIRFDGNTGKLKMILPEGGTGLGTAWKNMQEDEAAFEGWAAVLKALYMEDTGVIELDVDGPALPDFKPGKEMRHYGRFLYRAMRFRECVGFRLSERISPAVAAFEAYLSSHDFRNNYPESEIKGKSNTEALVESYFASESGSAALWKLLEQEGFRSDGVDIFRQLPVGLFQGSKAADVKTENAVFTGGSSAIDLWTVSGDTLLLFELKAADNKKVGAVTELFFYANYLYDMFVEPLPTFQSAKKPRKRGYQNLVSPARPLKQVKGFLLVEQPHPLFREDVLSVLKEPNGRRISYGMLQYHPEKNGKTEEDLLCRN